MINKDSKETKLKEKLGLLEQYCKEWGNKLSWSKILITEHQNIVYGKETYVLRKEMFSSQEYAKRFDELFNEGHSWININVAGIFFDTLIVIIEFPYYKNTTPTGKTSVNFSGPSIIDGEPKWDISDTFSVID